MRTSTRFTPIVALLLLSSAASAQDALTQGFQAPPNSAKAHTWWHWINGNISQSGITADLEAMKAAGLGGAQIFNVDVGIPDGNTPFMTPQWRSAMSHALREAKRLGLEICLHNCAGWSSSGGPWIKPEYAMQILTWSETPVTGPARFDSRLPEPEKRRGYYQDIAVFAVRKPKGETDTDKLRISNIRQKAAFDRGDYIPLDVSPAPEDKVTPTSGVVLVTEKIGADGRCTWNVPPGEWTLIRLGYTPTGAQNAPAPTAGRGLEVDKLSRKAMDTHWAGMMDTVLKDLGKDAPAALNNALIDSYEVGSQNWTPAFRKEFRKRRGYDCLPFLPVVTGRVIGDKATSERFLWDFRRTICDLFSENYFQYFRELCHKHGLKFSVEGYGNGAFDNLQVSGLADIPMGEFWVGSGMAAETTKLASSAAHTNGRTVVGAESFTADEGRGRWLVDPYSIKPLGDRIFTLGINRYIFHRYTHQPWSGDPADHLLPGMTMGPWGMNLERTITWWPQANAWLSYVARCQYLLQQGRFAADLVYFTGDDGPNDLPMLQRTLVPTGYDYDGCDTTVLHKMRVENGDIVLPSGMRYKALLLPSNPYLTVKSLRKIASLVEQGATVIGKRVIGSPSLSDRGAGEVEIARLSLQLWGSQDDAPGSVRKVGLGTVCQPLEKPGQLPLSIAPDVIIEKTARPPVWIHRKTNKADFYFVANQRTQSQRVNISFRVAGRLPELFHPETGTIETAPVWQGDKDRTTVTLSLGPAESVFVVFRKSAKGPHVTGYTLPSQNTPEPDKIAVEQAFYEAVDGAGGAEVTAKVRELVTHGETTIPADNATFGDPISLHVKRLRVVYTLNGKRRAVTVGENEMLDLLGGGGTPTGADSELFTRDQKTVLRAWAPGSYQTTWDNGTTTTQQFAGPQSFPVTSSWKVSFPPNLGAPPSITLDNLISWSEHSDPGVRFFSGSGTYQTAFTLPQNLPTTGVAHILDLGTVKNFAEVTLNGRVLPTLWKPPFRLDVTGLVHPGENTLTVRVTNLWPNRLIGDEQEPAEVAWNGNAIASWPDWLTKGQPRPASRRVTFTTWKFFSKDSALLESGLIGPVTLHAVPEVVLTPAKR